jgi:PKD repeat protein
MRTFITTACLVLCISKGAFSQQEVMRQNWCGSLEAMEEQFMKHPELRQRFNAYQAQANIEQNQQQQRTAVANYTIPVVFHVLHQYGAENISDAQINDQIAIFNRDFNRQNADTTVVIAPFKNLIGDVHFAFQLAKKDPGGNCTSGITRHYDVNTAAWDGDGANYIYTWDPTKYLNIYVVRTIASGAAGYAYYPGSLSPGDDMDAILILSTYVGSIGTSTIGKSRALTHEVGHWFNLQHTWGNTNNPGVACGNDQVNDTPVTEGFTSCPTQAASAVCTPGIFENYQNYMDYSYCSVMFTPGQVTRMTNAINNGVVGRNNLSSASNLSFTGISPVANCAPKANFTSNKQIVCINQPVSYTDISNISAPTSWSWTFPGGSPATSSVQNPTVSYSAPGTYSVLLTATNANGSTSESKVNYISVVSAPQTASLQEGFESSAIPNTTWSVRNMASLGTNWQQTSVAAASGSKSAKVDQSIDAGTSVELYSPAYNFAAMPGVALSFKWAGSERDASTTASSDVLNVQFSTDCGTTWTPRLSRTIKAGAVGVSASQAGNFVPNSSQFYQDNVPLAGLTSATNVMFKFRFTAEIGSSNHFYIDDINLTSATGIAEIPLVSNILIFPNPASDLVTVDFDLVDNKNVSVEMKDVLGRVVKTGDAKPLQAGHHQMSIALGDIAKGIYFISVRSNAQVVTQKLVIE